LERKSTRGEERNFTPERKRASKQSLDRGKKLDPDAKSWLDNVIIPALAREYVKAIQKQNQAKPSSISEMTSDQNRIKAGSQWPL
jgi:hypothetical protein